MTLQEKIEKRLQVLALEILDPKRDKELVPLLFQTSYDIRNEVILECAAELSDSLEEQNSILSKLKEV